MFDKSELLKQGFWSEKGPCSDTVISTRIRFARNVQSVPFPEKSAESEKRIIYDIAEKFCNVTAGGDARELIDLDHLSPHEKRLLREMNFITDEMEKRNNCAVVIDREGRYSIMINEEDHFRIQVIFPGLQLREAYERADRIDDQLNQIVPYAFTHDLGYLTACPSNIGTAMKASVLMHLPVLTSLKRIPELSDDLRKESVEFKGTNGAGNRTMGCIYQVANRISLGQSEVDILEFLDGLVNRIIDLEDEARDEFIAHHRGEVADRIFRSFGMVQYARRMSYAEAMEHLSNIRLGIILGMIRNTELHFINTMMVNCQYAHLRDIYEYEFASSVEEDIYRSEYLRMNFNSPESD